MLTFIPFLNECDSSVMLCCFEPVKIYLNSGLNDEKTDEGVNNYGNYFRGMNKKNRELQN